MSKRAALIFSCVFLVTALLPVVILPGAAFGAVIRESFKFVLVRATVVDKGGHIVNGLQPGDFRLTDNGTPQAITADIVSQPLSVVVAIESTGDVNKILPGFERLSSVFESLVLGESGELALISFDDHVRTVANFTSDPDKIDAAFRTVKFAGGSGNVNDAAIAGIKLLRDRPDTRQRVLILISQGRDKSGAAEVREVVTAAEFGNVSVYSMNMPHFLALLTTPAEPPRPNPIPPEARPIIGGTLLTPTTDSQMQMGNWIPAFKGGLSAAKGQFVVDPLGVYTRQTGGREFSVNNQDNMEKAISDLGEELHSQYSLTYMPSTQDQPGFHQIVVTVRQPDLTVRTRDGYWLAPKPD